MPAGHFLNFLAFYFVFSRVGTLELFSCWPNLSFQFIFKLLRVGCNPGIFSDRLVINLLHALGRFILFYALSKVVNNYFFDITFPSSAGVYSPGLLL